MTRFVGPSSGPILLALLLTVAGAVVTPTPVAGSPTIHDPILIEGDGGFTPANGVVAGTGSATDPYVIAGWDISGAEGAGIEIRNTSASFVIRDVVVHTSSSRNGIVFVKVVDGRLEQSTLSGNRYGFWIQDSREVSVAGTNGTANAYIGRVENSSGVRLERNNWSASGGLELGNTLKDVIAIGNTFSRTGGQSLLIWSGQNITLASNVFLSISFAVQTIFSVSDLSIVDNTFHLSGGVIAIGVAATNLTIRGNSIRAVVSGIHVIGSRGVQIDNNTLDEAQDALVIESSHDVLVQGNAVTAPFPYGTGIYATQSTNLTIRDNRFTRRETGIRLELSTSVAVYRNLLTSNNRHAVDDGALYAWNADYPTGGNYWSDYAGLDRCRGPAQDVCDAPDGFGDTPYAIDGNSADRYPWLPPNLPPTVAFEASRLAPSAGDPIVFDGTASRDPDGVVASYAWDFGDGWNGSGRLWSHHFSRAGDYTVRLTVTDDRGATGSTATTFHVTPFSGDFVIIEHPVGFRLRVPSDWDVQQNVSIEGATYEFVVTGSALYPVPFVLVNWERDPAVREDAAYVTGQVGEAIAAVLQDHPNWTVAYGPSYRPIGGHAGSSFVFRDTSSGQLLKFATVLSDVHDSFWLFALSTSQGTADSFPLADAVLEVMLDSFEITMPAVPVSPWAVDLTWLVAGIAVAATGVLVLFFLLFRRRSPKVPIGLDRGAAPPFPPTATVCPSCGTVTGDAAFCPSCGHPLRGPPESQPKPPA